MRKFDLLYVKKDDIISLIPNSERGKEIWIDIARMFHGDAQIPVNAFKSVRNQVIALGYTIHHSTKENIDVDQVLADMHL